jgi:hypothetical protein
MAVRCWKRAKAFVNSTNHASVRAHATLWRRNLDGTRGRSPIDDRQEPVKIRTVQQWFEHAPPKKGLDWKAGRSTCREADCGKQKNMGNVAIGNPLTERQRRSAATSAGEGTWRIVHLYRGGGRFFLSSSSADLIASSNVPRS